MTLKILQLNMLSGMYFPAIAKYLAENSFDILCFQEVGRIRPQHANKRPVMDAFEALYNVLGAEYEGKESIHNDFALDAIFFSQSNAIFYKKSFTVVDENTLWLYKRNTPFPAGRDHFEDMGRNAFHLTFSTNNKVFHVVNAHLAWAPTPIEQPYERAQNVKLVDYVSNLKRPFILTGDFNIQPDQQSILELDLYARNLTKENYIQNTLNGRVHKAWERINPGFPVDYIFVSPDVRVYDFQVLSDLDLSDHLGLTAEIEI